MFEVFSTLPSYPILKQDTYKVLLQAERMTRNPELLARCQYLRSYLEKDGSLAARTQREMTGKIEGTNFYRNEIRHCDQLTDYRNYKSEP